MFGAPEKTQDADPRIRSILDELEVKYEIDDDFDFRLGFELEGGRHQSAVIRSQTDEFLGIEIREIFSPAIHSQGPFDARTANILLQENRRLKIGAWGVSAFEENDSHIAVFTVKFAAELGAQEFQGVLNAVIRIADEMEQRLSGRDDF